MGKSEQGAVRWGRSEEGLAAPEQRTAGGRVETRCGAQLGSDQGAVGTDGMWKEVTDCPEAEGTTEHVAAKQLQGHGFELRQ